MTKVTRAALSLAAILTASSFIYAQPKPKDEPSLLYQISGKGLTKPSYLMGTIHAICPAEMVPISTLDTYLSQTDQLVTEVDLDDPNEMTLMTKSVMMPDGKTLNNFLNADEIAKVDELTKNYLGAPIEPLKQLKPWKLMVVLLTRPKAMGCTPATLDLELMKSAVAKKKPVIGLETVALQIQTLDSMPFDKQARRLYEMAVDPQKAIGDLRKLIDVYKTQDVEKLFEITASQLDVEKGFHTRLLDDRNIAWIPKLETAFKEKPTFVAVGAGHLGGKKGVLTLLREKGYTVTPVKL